MRVVKPNCISLISRPFEYRHRMFLGLAAAVFVPLRRRALLSEAAMWSFLGESLPEGVALDAGIPKKGGEVLLTGSAWSDPDADPTRCRVRLRCGSVDKTLHVFGDRFLTKAGATEPEPFESIPLDWSRAYGGEGFDANPLGKGAQALRLENGEMARPLPNIQIPRSGRMASDQTAPAGFGPIDPAWPARAKHAGTYDKAWLESDYPGFASDIDWRFFSAAPDDQRTARSFRGDERFCLENMHPESRRLEGGLPGISIRCLVRRHGDSPLEDLRTALTTLWFFPEAEYVVLIFHASASVEQPDGSDVETMLLAAEDLECARSIETYARVLASRLERKGGGIARLDDTGLIPETLEDAAAGFSAEPVDESKRGANARKRRERELAEAEQRISDGMAELGATFEPLEPPDFGIDPAALSRLSPNQLPPLIERMQAQQREDQAALETLKSESDQQLEQALDQLRADFPDSNVDRLTPIVGPPKFSAEDRRRQIKKGVEQLRSDEFDPLVVEQALLNRNMDQLLDDAEAAFIRFYRQGAHMQEAAPRAALDEQRRHAFLTAARNRESFDAVDWTGVDLSGLDLSGHDLQGVFLESANLSHCDLSGTNLENAVLARADLRRAVLGGTRLRHANLGRADLGGVRAREADLTGVVLHEADFSEARFIRCRFGEPNLTSVALAGAGFEDCGLERVLLHRQDLSGVSFTGCRMAGARMLELGVAECDFSGADLSGAVMMKCSARSASFVGATLVNARFVQGCDLTGVQLSGADLSTANLRDSDLSSARLDGAVLDGAEAGCVVAIGASFRGVSARSVNLSGADLQHADLAGANLMQASLERADLRHASLRGANLFAADLARVHVVRETDFDEALTTRMRTYPRKFPGTAGA